MGGISSVGDHKRGSHGSSIAKIPPRVLKKFHPLIASPAAFSIRNSVPDHLDNSVKVDYSNRAS
jgi:hypothetical protein